MYGTSSAEIALQALPASVPAYNTHTHPATLLTEMHYGTCTVKLDV